MPSNSTELQINKVLAAITSLENTGSSADEIKFLSEIGYPKLLKEVASLSERMPSYDELSDRSKFRLDNLSEVMISYAKLDFSLVPYVNENPIDLFDFVATGLNMMRYEMEKHIAALSKFKNIFSAIDKPIVITDKKGKILESNDFFRRFVGDESRVIGQSVQELIVDGFFESLTLPILNSTAFYTIEAEPLFSSIRSENGKETGRIYSFKIEMSTKRSLDKTIINLKDQLLEIADSFKNDVESVINVGIDKAQEKDKFLEEIRTSLKEKNVANKLSVTEGAWLKHLQYLMD
jgi:PAS domain-containing protein